MNAPQANANRHTDGFKLGRLACFQPSFLPSLRSFVASFVDKAHDKARDKDGGTRPLSAVHCLLLTLFLLAAGMMAGTAYGQKATGGTSTNLVGGYWVHTFTSVATAQFTPSESLTVQYLVVGGGGGGGNGSGGAYQTGGGGAGGLITSVAGRYSGGGTPGVGSTPNLPAALTASTAYDVTVGVGGPAQTTGGDSVFGNSGAEFARAKGGGAGGRYGNGSSGGSGGGGAGGGTGGAGTANQGFAGGGSSGDNGGGGGGAGNVGLSTANGGHGGPGLTNTITGSSVAYAGGGGGSGDPMGNGNGGNGGGGNGGGQAGTDGKGGGGGGGRSGTGGKGGSGIVIIRYKDVNTAPVAVGKNITIYMPSNSVTVTAQQMENGSTDADGDPLMFSINGQLSVTFTNGGFGDHTVTFAAWDGTAIGSCQQTVTVVQAGGGLLASGGDVVSIYTNYAGTQTQVVYGCHQYTGAGNALFIPKKALTVEYLVIGGGGGGGSGNGNGTGGGGAGGYRCSVVGEKSGGNNNAESVTNLTAPVSVPVTVGSGGGANTKGNASSFGAISADGGGFGGSGAGGSGGSGGGGGYLAGGGNGTSLQGCNGGPAFDNSGQWGGGGGGGAKTAGIGRVDASTHGNGGDGLASSITGGAPVTRAGGGASGNGNTGGTAGAGASAAGGGGSGGGNAGKNGSVIVRYEIPVPSVNVTAPSNNQVFAWNYASIAATATVANATVTSVDFYTNTASAAYGLAGSDSDPTGGYTLSLAGGSLPAGTNHIYAVMNATEGVFTSTTNAIIVETLPIVTVTFPTDGQSFANLSSITATATVSHGISPYTVTFYTNNETAVGTDSSDPYASSLLGPLAEGSYQIYAKVTDSNPNGADTVYSTTNTFTVLAPALAVSVAGPTEYPYNGMITSTATVVFFTGSYTVKFWTSSVPATVWGQAGTDGISTSPYGVSFGPLAPGQYSIRATVDDALPASATSSTYTVTVLTAPTVTLNTPTPGAQFALNASVTGTATCASGKTPYSVTFYTNKNGSAYGPAGTDAGTGTRTSFTNVLSSLGAGTYGVYAMVGDGYGSQATSGTNIFLVGGTLPTLSHRPPTAVTTGSATFNGFLSTTGNPSTYVYVLYGQNPSAWSFTNAVTAPVGGWTNNSPISVNIGSLAEGTYYYTIGASNGAPFNATTTASGTTNFITGEVTVQNTGNPAQYKAGGSSNGQFTIYRPATCTNAALVVSYTLSGATLSPSGSATLNAGITSAVVTVAPSLLVGYSSNAVLTLTAGAGNYPYGTPVANSATCTVLAADVTPTVPFWAWGGDSNFTITVSGRPYAVHMYTNVGSGYFIPSRSIKNVEYLVVGGGGGGGSQMWQGGGGGAGGYRNSVADELSGGNSSAESSTNLTVAVEVIVGQGGAGSGSTKGTKGDPSSFGSVVSLGGAGGGGVGAGPDTGCGSGGGGGYGPGGSGGSTGTSGQGRDGGPTWDGTPPGDTYGYGGGGGGGASANGNGLVAFAKGKGGDGLASSITGTSVTRAGGGKGGGGSAAGSGASNAGGGGDGSNGTGTAGKNGIVIVRYDITPPAGTMIMLR